MVVVSCECTDPLSDEEIRSCVDQVLRMRRQAEEGSQPGLRAANAAAAAVSEIARGLLSPFLKDLMLRVSSEEYFELSTSERRSQIARAIDLGLPVMQPEARAELVVALQGANANEIASLFRDTIDRRLPNRDLRAQAEFGLLKWVEWRRGIGDTQRKAVETIVTVSGWQTVPLRDWRRSIRAVFPEVDIGAELAFAREIGHLEAQRVAPGNLRPRECDHDQRLWERWLPLERDVNLLVDMRKRALQARELE